MSLSVFIFLIISFFVALSSSTVGAYQYQSYLVTLRVADFIETKTDPSNGPIRLAEDNTTGLYFYGSCPCREDNRYLLGDNYLISREYFPLVKRLKIEFQVSAANGAYHIITTALGDSMGDDGLVISKKRNVHVNVEAVYPTDIILGSDTTYCVIYDIVQSGNAYRARLFKGRCVAPSELINDETNLLTITQKIRHARQEGRLVFSFASVRDNVNGVFNIREIWTSRQLPMRDPVSAENIHLSCESGHMTVDITRYNYLPYYYVLGDCDPIPVTADNWEENNNLVIPYSSESHECGLRYTLHNDIGRYQQNIYFYTNSRTPLMYQKVLKCDYSLKQNGSVNLPHIDFRSFEMVQHGRWQYAYDLCLADNSECHLDQTDVLVEGTEIIFWLWLDSSTDQLFYVDLVYGDGETLQSIYSEPLNYFRRIDYSRNEVSNYAHLYEHNRTHFALIIKANSLVNELVFRFGVEQPDLRRERRAVDDDNDDVIGSILLPTVIAETSTAVQEKETETSDEPIQGSDSGSDSIFSTNIFIALVIGIGIIVIMIAAYVVFAAARSHNPQGEYLVNVEV